MNKKQLSLLGITFALIIGLYFIPIKPSDSDLVDRSRALEMEATDESTLIKTAKDKYSTAELADIQVSMDMFGAAKTDEGKLPWLEKISGSWYALGEPALAGVYAEKIAELRNDEESWAIAGTTYASGIRHYKEHKNRMFCQGRAVKALENAISINPKETNHRLNLALCYVGLPPEENPMKGILMLREMVEKDPKNVAVLSQLGQLAIQTGQYDKAIERLNAAFMEDSGNKTVLTYLIAAHKAKGDTAKAVEYERMLNKLN